MTKYDISHDKLTIEKDNQKVTVRRVKRGNLKNFLEKHEAILRQIVENNFAWGEILENDIAYNDLKAFCKLIPTDESTDGLDFNFIENDYEFLNLFFVSTSYDVEKDEFENINNGQPFKYSLLSKLMGIENSERLGKTWMDHQQNLAIQKREEQQRRIQTMKDAGVLS